MVALPSPTLATTSNHADHDVEPASPKLKQAQDGITNEGNAVPVGSNTPNTSNDDDLSIKLETEALSRLARTPFSWSKLQSIILSPHTSDLSQLARSHEQQRTYRQCRVDIKNEWESIYDYLLCRKFGFEWEWCDIGDSGDIGEGSNGKEYFINGNGVEEVREVKEVREGASSSFRRKKRSRPTYQEWHLSHGGSLESPKNKSHAPSKVVLSPNDFPYYFAPGIDHWILWKLGGGDITREEIVTAKVEILQSFPATVHARQKCKENLYDVVDDTALFLHWINPPNLRSLPGIDHVHILFHRSQFHCHL